MEWIGKTEGKSTLMIELKKNMNDHLDNIKSSEATITSSLVERKKWFAPWQQLLTLIQITEDGVPVSLDKIVEVVNCPEKQAEDLVKLLLSENELIGTYNSEAKVYTKGINVNVYIEKILSKIKELDFET